MPLELPIPREPITAFLRRHAEAQPDKAAIRFYGRTVTYAQLDDETNRFARALRRLGVRPGDRVALFLENCPQFVVAYHGALRAGAVVVPANPMFKEAELEHELRDSGARVVVALDHLYPMVARVRGRTSVQHVVVTGIADYLPEVPELPLHPSMTAPRETFPDTLEFGAFLDAAPGETVEQEIEPEQVALLQYTSGTTGLPKGAMITQRNLMSTVVIPGRWLRTTADDIHLCVLPLFHVTGMQNSMNVPIWAGNTIVLLARFDTETVVRAIHQYRVTKWVGITTMNIAVANYPDTGRYDLTSLRFCTSGGAPIPVEVLRKFQETTGSALLEGYGLSETISACVVNPPHRIVQGSIGVPLPNVDIQLVDPEDPARAADMGEVGELLVRGPMVMKGYWNRPEATREALRDGWLHTGDLAAMDEDGYLYIRGRKKELIKASGYSVFPSEVEALLHEHPAVAECAVIGVPHPYRGEEVKAFVVLKSEFQGTVSAEQMVRWARDHMAAYKYPRQVEIRSALPKTGSGKILKRVLVEEEQAGLRSPG
jgi:acyl-CoA synthetase (AMP-forming)/AMP-acid ligase II